MREIKFRAWNKDKKEMYQDRWSYLEFDRKFRWFLTEGDGGGPLLCNFMNGILMQFTGLKDKNGKEIYEGDIVKFITNYDEKERIGKIIFELDSFDIEENDEIHSLLLKYLSNIEVIGNIFENPELIK